MAFTNLSQSLKYLRPWGAFVLVFRKITKHLRYKKMLAVVPHDGFIAGLKEQPKFTKIAELSIERDTILSSADAMLRDENVFFTFPYHTKGIDRPWEFDPIENKYWPRRYYTERILHDHDTPRDVKIVFEINRFKNLPTLGQAACLTGDKKYADEVERRLLSWIEDNPFAQSVNWSSALEISIRLIAWTTTLLLLKEAGFNVADHPKIKRSIYEQVCYLVADLGTDKVVSTNHLIGEAAGLFVTASLWEFNEHLKFTKQAQHILEREIIKQTFPDGVTREASSWYHQFVTHFFDLTDRIATRKGNPFSNQFQTRLSKMKAYLGNMIVNNHVVRYGDSDDGWALFLEGNLDRWKSVIFGSSSVGDSDSTSNYYPDTKVIATHSCDSFLFLRAGAFGMGGAGFSSHAHDDFLSPIIRLAGLPVVADPGTFVYSGDPEKRRQYRIASTHNGIIFGNTTGAIPRKQFGWEQIRPDAAILKTNFNDSKAIVAASYGEWPEHQRTITIDATSARIEDRFIQPVRQNCEWRFHLAPEWTIEHESLAELRYQFLNKSGDRLNIELQGEFKTIAIESYDYSPSYLVAQPATMLQLTTQNPTGIYTIHLSIERAA